MKTNFKIEPYQEWDKSIIVCETNKEHGRGLALSIDYDDVYHPTIKKKINKLVKLLNEHWDDK